MRAAPGRTPQCCVECSRLLGYILTMNNASPRSSWWFLVAIGLVAPACAACPMSATPAEETGGNSSVEWEKASLTWFISYPDPGSEECIKYNGCMWAGYFAAIDGKQPESWVKEHNIAAVHSKDFEKYKLKTLRLRKNGKEI